MSQVSVTELADAFIPEFEAENIVAAAYQVNQATLATLLAVNVS